MNLTFNQFLEQRDPELYNQMLNEGMFDFVGKGIEKVKKFFNPALLMNDVKENGKKIDAYRNAGFWEQKPEEVKSLIKDNIDKLQKIREEEKWAKENPKSFNKAVNDFSRIIRSAAAAGVISVGLVGLWNAQSVQDNKFDDTYKGDTSGYVAKPSAAEETPTPEAEPTAAPTVQSQGGSGKLPHLLGKDVEDRGPLGKIAYKLTHPLGGKLAAKAAVRRGEKDDQISGGGIVQNMRDRIAKRGGPLSKMNVFRR